ncbi:MAG: sigma-54-dependent Fis family transcriptional regulator [Candidatus Schekmanbacteria bacterium]|nr:sigma-54-dependent Fis family transcriptional regulator [Candidatus Schekmanbacteria bacterium]
MVKPRILIVDDELSIRDSLAEIISLDGYEVLTSYSAEKALDVIQKNQIDIILLDMVLPGMGGLDLLKLLKGKAHPSEIIMITAYSTIETAVLAIKSGAYDYLIKPCNNEEVKLLIKRIAENNALKRENQILREQLSNLAGLSGIVSKSKPMEQVFHLMQVAAPTMATVLICGETGTGKEMVARALHQLSPRCDKPFIKIDCASLPADVLESELFGHEKGAFTSAINKRQGRVEMADSGTLFLDEISSLPLELQGKILRLLQEKELERVGSNETIKVDIRILAATNVNLQKSVEQGTFRIDLYYRLNVFNITLPPLRDRKEDIPLLINYFIEKANQENHKNVKGVSPEGLRLILNYNWPGNIRELKNYVERAVLLEPEDFIGPANLPGVLAAPQENSAGGDFRKKIMSYEKELIINTLKKCDGKKTEAAGLLGLSPRIFSYYLSKYKINKK